MSHTKLPANNLRTDVYRIACLTFNSPQYNSFDYPTYVPPTHSDRPPLHWEWAERARLRREEQLKEAECAAESRFKHVPARLRAEMVQNEVSRNALHPNLKQLLVEAAEMRSEADAEEEKRRECGKHRIKLLGATPDLCGGLCDGLLQRTRELTGKSTAQSPLDATQRP